LGLIFPYQGFLNIGHRIDGQQWIREKWNPRYHQAIAYDDTGLPCPGNYEWLMRRRVTGQYSYGRALDSARNWTIPYQDITIVFNSKMEDAALTPGNVATGHTIKVNTVTQTTNYMSGSGDTAWVLRVPILFDQSDAVTYSYDQAIGNTTAVDNAQELGAITDWHVSNFLTKRIRFNLLKADDTPAASETVKVAVLKYNSGTVENTGDNIDRLGFAGTWLKREMEFLATTDSNGLLDALYNGPSAVGGTVYLIVIRPNTSPTESLIWTYTIQ